MSLDDASRNKNAFKLEAIFDQRTIDLMVKHNTPVLP